MKGGASLEANPVADVIDTQAPPSPFCEQDAPESAFAEGEAADENAGAETAEAAALDAEDARASEAGNDSADAVDSDPDVVISDPDAARFENVSAGDGGCEDDASDEYVDAVENIETDESNLDVPDDAPDGAGPDVTDGGEGAASAADGSALDADDDEAGEGPAAGTFAMMRDMLAALPELPQQRLLIANFPPHVVSRLDSDWEWLITNDNVTLVSSGTDDVVAYDERSFQTPPAPDHPMPPGINV